MDDIQHAEVGAVDLHTGALLWRARVPTHGLLNIVAAPHLSVSSTYEAIRAWPASADHAHRMLREVPRMLTLEEAFCERCLPENMPHLRLQDKHAMSKTLPFTPDPPGVPWEVELGSVSDRVLAPLVAAVRDNDTLWTPDHQRRYNAHLSGRQNTIDRLKPGVQTIHFIFSSPGGELVFRLPWWYSWQPVLRPLLEEVRPV